MSMNPLLNLFSLMEKMNVFPSLKHFISKTSILLDWFSLGKIVNHIITQKKVFIYKKKKNRRKTENTQEK